LDSEEIIKRLDRIIELLDRVVYTIGNTQADALQYIKIIQKQSQLPQTPPAQP